MAVLIETATAAEDAVNIGPGVFVDGFTPGDPQAGIAPTQLSADWCNQVTGEIDSVINGIDAYDTPMALDGDNVNQVRNAISARFLSNYPKSFTGAQWVFEWRSQWHDNAAAGDWKRYERSDREENATDDTTYNMCQFFPPDGSQFIVEYTCVLVNPASITSRCNVKMIASGRRSTNVTIQDSQTVFEDNPGATITVTVEAVTTAVAIRVDIPATGGTYNIFITGTLTVVTDDV